MKNPVGKNPKTNKGIFRVKGRGGKLSFLIYNKFLSGETLDILESDYSHSGVLAKMIKVKRLIVEQAESTTARERVLLIVIGLIVAGEIYYRALGGSWCG